MKFTKLTSLVSAVLMLAGTGSIATNTLSAQTVKADDIPTVHGKWNDTDQEMQFNPKEFLSKTKNYWNIRTVPYNLNGHNDIKFHWWKKPHFKMAYGSVNQLMDQNDDAAAQGAGLNTVDRYYIGTVTINGEKRYIAPEPDLNDGKAAQGDHVTLPTYDFEKPTELRHTTDTLDGWYPTEDKGHIRLGVSQNQFDKNNTVVVYKDSKPIRLAVPGYGSVKMIPVTYVNNMGNGLVMLDYNDFKNFTKRGAKHQRSSEGFVHFTLNGQNLTDFSFTRGPVKFRNGSWGNSNVVTYKAANKYLHSAKWRKAIEKKFVRYQKFFAKQVRDQGYIG